MAKVHLGGHISGAHHDPPVSFAAFLRGKIGITELVTYWAVQLLAAGHPSQGAPSPVPEGSATRP